MPTWLWLRITKEYGFLAIEALVMPRRMFRLHSKSIKLFPQLWQALVQSTCPQTVDALVPTSAHCGGLLWRWAMPQEAFYIHPRESPGMKRHEWCVYGTFVSFRPMRFMMLSPIISLGASLEWITTRNFRK